jgi:hypothetical protein
MSFHYSPKIITEGLVLYLDAANTRSYVSGSTTWNDISRSGNNGTLINGPTFNSGNGGSIVFDGVNDYVALGNNFQNGPLTILTWINTTTFCRSKSILSNCNAGWCPRLMLEINRTAGIILVRTIWGNTLILDSTQTLIIFNRGIMGVTRSGLALVIGSLVNLFINGTIDSYNILYFKWGPNAASVRNIGRKSCQY